MRETGRTISNMDLERRFGTMALRLMREISWMERKTERVNSPGMTALTTRETSLMGSLKELVPTISKRTKRHISVSSVRERLMVKVR